MDKPAADEADQPCSDDSVFDDADALIALAQRSFTTAAQAAVAENDRLGIPTHGSVRGKLVVRRPADALDRGGAFEDRCTWPQPDRGPKSNPT